MSDKVHKPEVVSAIITLNAALKIHGGEIEANNKINMDKHQVIGTEGKFSLMKYQNTPPSPNSIPDFNAMIWLILVDPTRSM